MSVTELLATLKEKDVQLVLKGEQLVVQGNKQALSEPALLARLREYKPQLIELIKAGKYSATKAGQVQVPANGITTFNMFNELGFCKFRNRNNAHRFFETTSNNVPVIEYLLPLVKFRKAFETNIMNGRHGHARYHQR